MKKQLVSRSYDEAVEDLMAVKSYEKVAALGGRGDTFFGKRN